MSDREFRKWAREFKAGRTNVNDEERSGRPSVIRDDLMQAVEKKLLRTVNSRDNQSFIAVFRRFSVDGAEKL
ncbi:hypothetical protein TNCV_5060471 [Trichonephila clavipes]|nr:hypothetical protein TNCV_5060471 [Trichonephila clavipes]